MRDYAHGLSPGFRFAPLKAQGRRPVFAVPMVVGACYAMQRDAYEQLGGFCPLLSTYGGDEADLSARAWLSGRGVRCVQAASVGHLDRTRFPYPVAYDDVEFNQLVMIRSLFEAPTVAALETYFEPLPPALRQRLAEIDILSWRERIQSQRHMCDIEFFRRIAPLVPLAFRPTAKHRRGHLPSQQLQTLVDAEPRHPDALRHAGPWPPAPALHLLRAGVVAWNGAALLLPGDRSSGLQGLVAALVEEGATFCSDSFAALDALGRVVVVPAGEVPLRVAVIAVVQLTQRRSWSLRVLPAAQAALYLVANAVGEAHPGMFHALQLAVQSASAFEGRRGPAGPLARRLLRSAMPPR